jgi:hypothetical protein
MTVATTSLLFMSASIPADVVYVQDVLGVRDYGIGIVLTGWTVGMLLAANFLAPRIPVASLAVAACAPSPCRASEGTGADLARLLVHGRLLRRRRSGHGSRTSPFAH